MRGESANLLSVGSIDFGLVVDATVIMVEGSFDQAFAIVREIAAQSDVPTGRRGLPLRIKMPMTLAAVTAVTLTGCIGLGLSREREALEQMAIVSGWSTATFLTRNAAVLAADNAGLPPEQQDWAALQAFALSAGQDSGIRDLVVADASGVVRASSDAGSTRPARGACSTEPSRW